MAKEEILIFCKFLLLNYYSANDGGFGNTSNIRDVYTNGFLDSLRQSRVPHTPMIRNRSKWKTIREKNDFYMKTQSFSNWRQKRVSSAYRRYQINRDVNLAKPKRKQRKYSTIALAKKYKNGWKKKFIKK